MRDDFLIRRRKGEYRIEGDAFVYIDHKLNRVVTILGYPTRRIAELIQGQGEDR